MTWNYSFYDEIKRKIRKLKKLEIKIRFGYSTFKDYDRDLDLYIKQNGSGFVWDEFFDLHEVCKNNVKYSLYDLAGMNKDEFKNVINEYFFNVYYRYYKENGMVNFNLFDPDILLQLGLPFDADMNMIKKRFRELAKKYHPDMGGDSEKFIELMENYRKLVN